MPHDPDGQQATPAAAQTPEPISVPTSLWQLDADPPGVEAVAEVLRGVGSAGESARDAMDRAVFRVFADGAWEGDTADAFQDHRAKLGRDLGEFTDATRPAARVLDEIAAVLRHGQSMLKDERERLREVPAYQLLGMELFQPRDDGETAAVRAAVAAAEDIRQRVDQQLCDRTGEFRRAQAPFETISRTWQPDTVRHLNLNAGMGHANRAGDEGGDPDATNRHNLDELAAAIAGSDADVVTLQEVFESNLYSELNPGGGASPMSPGLLARLQQATGDQWEVASFAEATQGRQWDPRLDADAQDPPREPFGNVVLVRTGGAVEEAEARPPVELQPDREEVLGEPVQGRTAAVAEVTLDE